VGRWLALPRGVEGGGAEGLSAQGLVAAVEPRPGQSKYRAQGLKAWAAEEGPGERRKQILESQCPSTLTNIKALCCEHF